MFIFLKNFLNNQAHGGGAILINENNSTFLKIARLSYSSNMSGH